MILPAQESARLRLKAGDEVEIVADENTLHIIPLTRIKPVSVGGLWKGVRLSEREINEARHETWGDLLK